jgi:pyridoxamine 5'-phosphate oxidase
MTWSSPQSKGFSQFRFKSKKRAMKSHQEIPQLLGSENPFQVFGDWLGRARQCKEIREPTAMVLSTCLEGQPHSRVVLLKDFNEDGFVFYTNYRSGKGRELKQNPRAALNFYWDPLALQCRVEGVMETVSDALSDAYWKSRARESQISQWISHQSEAAESRGQLEGLVQAAQEKFKGEEIPRPPHWGGYRLRPEKFEFWIGRANRLHDRILLTREKTAWSSRRLFP